MTAPHDCSLCSALCSSRTQPVNGSGRGGGIMIVGQSPGYYEDREWRSLTGKSNELLGLMCRRAGISKSVVYITNAVRCLSPGNRKPKKLEVTNCRPYLIEEIQDIAPKVIVALGDVALQSLYSVNRGVEEYNDSLALWQIECQELLNDYEQQKQNGFKLRKPKMPLKPKPPKADNLTISSVLGHTLIQPDTGIPLIPTYSLGFIRNGKWNYTEIMSAHLEKAKSIMQGTVVI